MNTFEVFNRLKAIETKHHAELKAVFTASGGYVVYIEDGWTTIELFSFKTWQELQDKLDHYEKMLA